MGLDFLASVREHSSPKFGAVEEEQIHQRGCSGPDHRWKRCCRGQPFKAGRIGRFGTSNHEYILKAAPEHG